jgi:hypothetical protein
LGKSYPDPPDPKDTSSAATSTNVGTAIANAWMQNANQITPDGALKYDQTGTKSWFDPYTGKTYEVPTFTATQTLSPEAQAIRDKQLAAQTSMAGLAQQQAAKLTDLLGSPVDLSNDAVEGRLFDLGRKRLDPLYADKRAGLEQQLANQGIALGSKGYETAMQQLSQAENDAYNQLLLQGRGQSVQEILAARNQPINETTALISGSQVSQPSFVNANIGAIPTTDVAGLINDNYQQRLAKAQAENSQTAGILGALFGFGGQLLASDRRVKTDVKRVGTADNGLAIYSYHYTFGGPVMLGFMADEVEMLHPEAVHSVHGIKAVDYAKAVL